MAQFNLGDWVQPADYSPDNPDTYDFGVVIGVHPHGQVRVDWKRAQCDYLEDPDDLAPYDQVAHANQKVRLDLTRQGADHEG